MDDKGRLIMPLQSGKTFVGKTFKELQEDKPEGSRKQRRAHEAELKKGHKHVRST